VNYLKNKTTYLCGNINVTETNDYGTTWRDNVTPELETRFGIKVINPCKDGFGDASNDLEMFKQWIRDRDFVRVKQEFYRVIRKDLRAVDKADFLIFYHVPRLPTVGSIHEVINAVAQKKPVLIVVKEDEMDQLNPWLLTLIKPQWLFNSWNEMYVYLDKIDNGDIDTSHWW
jgi:hypothetical protein